MSFREYILLQRAKIKYAEEHVDRSQPIDRICDGCGNFDHETRECLGIGFKNLGGPVGGGRFRKKPSYPPVNFCPRRWMFHFHDHDVVDDDWRKRQYDVWEYLMHYRDFLNSASRGR